MASWEDIGKGIAAQFQPVGLRSADYMQANIDPPAVMCNLSTMKPSTMGRGWFESEWDVFILVSSANDRSGQRDLRRYLDPTGDLSVWVAFGLNNNLDLTDGTRATLVDYRSFSIEEVAALPYFGGVLAVTVTTPGA